MKSKQVKSEQEVTMHWHDRLSLKDSTCSSAISSLLGEKLEESSEMKEAEAEVEYQDKVDLAIHVAFPLRDDQRAKLAA